MLASDIMKFMNELAPLKLAESWDNSGFQLGSKIKSVDNLLLALDITPDVVSQAKEEKIDMIITHHPFIFSPLKNIPTDTTKGKMIVELLKNNITVYSAHTNLDACIGGVNDVLADILKLNDTLVLDKSNEEKMYKLVVFVPKTHKDIVRNSMTDVGAGHIGKYSHCTYNTEGIGTFMPRENTNPFIGKEGVLEKVEEVRIETIVKQKDLKKVLKNMIENHPYEEVAYDIYSLNNSGEEYGIGRIGTVDKEIRLEEFAKTIKEKLGTNNIRVYGDINKLIKKVAVCGGSGADFIQNAANKNADVLVTGDVRSYEAMEALQLGIAVIDAGHYYTERIILPELKKYLKEKSKDMLNILISDNDDNAPFISY